MKYFKSDQTFINLTPDVMEKRLDGSSIPSHKATLVRKSDFVALLEVYFEKSDLTTMKSEVYKRWGSNEKFVGTYNEITFEGA